MVDLVYVVGTGSTWEDEELRMSLRSVEMYAYNYRRIVIVGTLPEWLDERRVIHIPYTDSYYKERNIMEGYLLASKDSRVTEDWVMMCDDFYLTLPTDMSSIPTYVRPYDLYEYVWGESREQMRWARYTRIIEDTYYALLGESMPYLTYDLHTPMPINSSKYIEAVEYYMWAYESSKRGVTYRSIYGNYHRIPATVMADVKHNNVVTGEGLYKAVQNLPYYSSGDVHTDRAAYQYVWGKMYPHPSIYEKDGSMA